MKFLNNFCGNSKRKSKKLIRVKFFYHLVLNFYQISFLNIMTNKKNCFSWKIKFSYACFKRFSWKFKKGIQKIILILFFLYVKIKFLLNFVPKHHEKLFQFFRKFYFFMGFLNDFCGNQKRKRKKLIKCLSNFVKNRGKEEKLFQLQNQSLWGI